MMIEIEHELDPQTMVIAELHETDESFDDMDNHYPATGIELRDIKVITWVDGMEINVTDILKKTYPKYFSDLEKKLISKYQDDLEEAV